MTGTSSLTVYPTPTPGSGLSREASDNDRPVAALVLAHGAGAGQRSRFMMQAGREMAARGITTATFDFPYVIAGRKVPDRTPVLEEAWRDAIETVRGDAMLQRLPLFIGGKSMGGRIASQVAASGAGIEGVRGLLFLGYPLHPPGKPEQRRDAHLPQIHLPMLFVQGSRDELGTADEIGALLPSLQRAQLFVVESGDHSFKVPARVGKPDDVLGRVFDVVAEFIMATLRRT